MSENRNLGNFSRATEVQFQRWLAIAQHNLRSCGRHWSRCTEHLSGFNFLDFDMTFYTSAAENITNELVDEYGQNDAILAKTW